MEGPDKCLRQVKVKIEDSNVAGTSAQSAELQAEDESVSETKIPEGFQQGRGVTNIRTVSPVTC